MKKVLGLDLGTASVGWAVVSVSENGSEKASILGCGSRVVPISSDEKSNFEKGKAITTNADRRLKRSLRRNLQRRKLRRDSLRALLLEQGWIADDTVLSEEGKESTFSTLQLRAKAASEQISLQDLAKVLLSISKKRGYKSSRKTETLEDGRLIDGMDVARTLQKENLTPAEFALRSATSETIPRIDFYRSDLEAEFSRIWDYQKAFYPDILTEDFKKQLARQGKNGTSRLFFAKYGITPSDLRGQDRRKIALTWRVSALTARLEMETLAYVISDLRGEISTSSGYLGEISDRSKELYFSGETVGQYLVRMLQTTPGFSVKGKVFYRQDYRDEFNRIWDTQQKFHPELTDALKRQISERILFYQRPLRSQKNHISFCEFESHAIKVVVDGKEKIKLTGSRVAPRSSFLFQEFKVWQILTNLQVIDRAEESKRGLSDDEMTTLHDELSIRNKMKQAEALRSLGLNPRRFELNYKELPGNDTMSTFYQKYLEIVALSGHGEYDLSKMTCRQASGVIREVLTHLGCRQDIFSVSTDLPKDDYERQPLFKLWHLLYSYEGDNSKTGIESLLNKISALTNLDREYASVLASISFKDDYASLSHKAIKKILPFMKLGHRYDEACAMAGYNHAGSMTADERERKELCDKIDLLPMGSLRNPVVEKIINQMVNVINAVADEYGKPDEIHIELARELKKSAKEREQADADIQANNRRNEAIIKILQSDFHLQYVRKADIVRYRLYDELKENGYKTLYSGQYIPASALFSKDIDIEHIIPQALMFDDSFANKTLEFKDINIEKGRRTANDYVKTKWGESYYADYRLRIDDLMNRGVISKKKRNYLIMTEGEIPSGFVDRDLRNSQYIARKAKELLEGYVRTVVSTTGAVTQTLREQWQLVDVMKEINFDKYDKAGKTFVQTDPDGKRIKRINEWTKRNDHRHHAMDALTIAFTKESYIQYLNNLHARSDKSSSIYAIEQKELKRDERGKLRFVPPMPLDLFRKEAKRQLEDVLVSIKSKTKVMTRNTNKTKKKGNETNKKIQLTPRGQLHNETIYGKIQRYVTNEVKVGSAFDESMIQKVAKKNYREALMKRLMQHGGDPQKAFTGKNAINKTPLWIDALHTQKVPEKVKVIEFEDLYPIRKPVGPDLKVEKVIDHGIRKILENRLNEFNGNAREAFSNLEENPIWLNKGKGISIKRVTIQGVKNAIPLHEKKDHHGKPILTPEGKAIPVDYVQTSGNHHLALYRDADGNLQDVVVSFFEATVRKANGQPVIDRDYKSSEGWQFILSLKQNEYIVFPNPETGFNPKEIDLTDPKNYATISKNMYRVQKFSKASGRDYWFRHHLETTVQDDNALLGTTFKRISSLGVLNDIVKVRVNHIGQIVAIENN